MGVHQTKIGLESIKNLNWQGKTVLDVGCGSGKLTFEVLKATSPKKIIGIDIDKDKIKKAKKLFEKEKRASFFVADARDLILFKNDTFDIVFSNIAFQLFDDKFTSLTEIRRVLKPKGEAIINFIEEKSEVRQEMDKLVSEPPFNKLIKKGSRGKKIPKNKFDKLAKKAGFSKVKSLSKNDTLWYPTVDSLLNDYQGFEIVFPQLKKLPKKLLDLLWQRLKKEFCSRKTPRGFGETWKVVFARLIK